MDDAQLYQTFIPGNAIYYKTWQEMEDCQAGQQPALPVYSCSEAVSNLPLRTLDHCR